MIIRKAFALLCAGVMLFATVGAVNTENATTVIDNGQKSINITYSNFSNEQIGIIVYDVTAVENASSNTEFIDQIQTPVIGIDQSIAKGSFKIPVNMDLEAKVVVKIAGENSGGMSMLIDIAGGIPTPIEVSYDAKNLEYILAENEQIEISESGILMNAVIDATKGTVLYGDTVLNGRIFFGTAGQIDAADTNTTVTLKSKVDGKEGYYNHGFIKKADLSNVSDQYIITLSASRNGEVITKEIPFDVESGVYSGEARFRIGIKNVPDGVEIICE